MKADTIAAIATALSDAGIGIIRVSGPEAISVVDQIFYLPSGKRILSQKKSHTVSYGYIADPAWEGDWKKGILDEVLVILMRAPKSYTGEDTVEINCHGGVLLLQKVLQLVLEKGARLAQPGEFTKRAFLNGRMDLSRAEAVMDVIHSQNELALSSSMEQLTGRVSGIIKDLRENILYEIAYIESALDDPEHISLEGFEERLAEKCDSFLKKLEKLIASADNGKLIKEGIRTVILGKPNAGKSSLMNAILGEDRAIVTKVPGTTRDVLQENIRLKGISLHMVDTAGIRQTEDPVEQIGVEKAREYAKKADLILYVVDGSEALDERDEEIISFIRQKNIIVLLNKSDLPFVVTEEQVRALFPEKENMRLVKISASEGIGLEQLEDYVEELFFQGKIKENQEIVITNMRHKQALEEARNSLLLVQQSLRDRMPEDFYSIDLMNAYASLGTIIGEEVGDDLIQEIFSKFCMGK